MQLKRFPAESTTLKTGWALIAVPILRFQYETDVVRMIIDAQMVAVHQPIMNIQKGTLCSHLASESLSLNQTPFLQPVLTYTSIFKLNLNKHC